MRGWKSWLGGVLVCLGTAAPASAIVRSWDDAGGSPSKLWGDFGNWNPDGAVAFDILSIGDLPAAANDTTLMDDNHSIVSIAITNGADVINSTDGGVSTKFRLTVNGATTISDAGSSMVIYGGTPVGLDTDTLTVNNGAQFVINSQQLAGNALIEVDNGALTNNVGGQVVGNGRIDLLDALAGVTTLFDNEGTLTAGALGVLINPPSTTLQITATSANARVDLDGATGGDGVVSVNRNATLDIDVPISDSFDGDINLASGATLDIAAGWSLSLGAVEVNTPGLIVGTAGAAAHLAGGTVSLIGGTLTLNDNLDSLVIDAPLSASGGVISNSGRITFNNTTTINSADNLQSVGSSTELIVNSTVNIGGAVVAAGEDFNWDGGGSLGNQTTVNSNGDLNINVENIDSGSDDTFDGTLTMNSGSVDVQVGDGAWTMNGQLNISNTGGDIPILSGDTISLSGDLDVSGTGESRISANVNMSGTPTVDVAAGATLRFSGTSLSTNSVAFSGAGTIQLDSTTTTVTGLTVNMPAGTVDLDGSSLGSERVLITGPLVLNVAGIDTDNEFDSDEIEISTTGQLAVNLTDPNDSWVMDGVLDLDGPGGAVFNTHLAGSDVELRGTVDVSGNSRTDARVNITGTVNLVGVDNFALSGGNTTDRPNRIEGGVVNGPGVLSADTGSSLTGHGLLNNLHVDFSENADLFADDGTLNINGPIDDVNILGATSDGILDISAAWNTNVTGAVSIFGGEVTGQTITNDGALGIGGRGLLSARVINNTRIQGHSGGTLVVQTPANNNDWDGAGTGLLYANGADLDLRDDAAFLFSGTVTVNAGRTVFANGFELEFEPTSTLNLTNGTYRSTNATDIGGTVNVNAGGTSTLQVGGTVVFENGSNTTLGDNLRLDNPTRINVGATFSGGGQLVNLAGRTLTIVDGADVDVAVRNEGFLSLGLSPGQTQGLDFEQTGTGSWIVEIGGTSPVTDFDRITLAGVAQLAGTLNLSFINGFENLVAVGNTFNILSAAGGVSGTFGSVLQPVGMPMQLMFDVNYDIPNIVQLVVISAAMPDLNMDGVVDIFDINIVSDNWGGPGPAGDANKDGVVDIFDINLISDNWSPSGGAEAVPEPSTWLLLAAAAVGLPWVARKRRSR